MKKRVLQIISYMYPAISGNGQTAYDISNCLPRDQYDQMIICFNTTGFVDVHDARGTKTVHEKLGDIPITRCGVITNIASQLLSPSYPGELKKVLKSFEPDVVILHCPNPFLAEFILPYLKNKKFKLVLYWHSDIVKQKLIGKLFNRQNEKLLTYTDKVVVTSPNYIDGSVFLRKYRWKCVVVPSCIREDQNDVTVEVDRLAREIRNRYKDKIICFALGRHVPYKGFEYLIEASNYLDDGYDVFIGSEGPLTEKLKEQAKGNNRIHFTGRLSANELKAYYQACDIFCFSSITKNEAYGLALADALYYGKPAVTFTIEGSGVNYVSLDGVTGIECPNRDCKAYAEAIKKLGRDANLRHQFGENGKKRADKLFLYKRFKENINILVGNLTV